MINSCILGIDFKLTHKSHVLQAGVLLEQEAKHIVLCLICRNGITVTMTLGSFT